MKKYIRLFLMCLAMALVVKNNSNVVNATDYYVSNEKGNNQNDGTINYPLKTIQKALDIVKAGDNVYIMNGTYNEQLTIKSSGTKDEPIIISNYMNDNPIVDGTNKSDKNQIGGIALLSIINKNYIEVEGIEFKNIQTTTRYVVHGINIAGYGEGITIKNCKVHDIKTNNTTDDANGHGISIYGSSSTKPISNIVLENNEVYNCKLGSSESIVLNGNVTNFIVRKNIVHDNDNIGIDFIGYEGVAGSEEQDRARNGICVENIVYNITSKNNHVYHGSAAADGIYVDGGCDILIERNIVKGCNIGIAASSEHKNKCANDVIIRNNLVTNCKEYAGISFGGASTENGMAKSVKIYNNTIYNCYLGVVIQNANINTNQVKNNIIYKCDIPISGKVGENDISNNFTNDPLFVDIANDNFRLQSTSDAINKGLNVEFGEYDLDGNARVYNDVVDLGCYEYKEEPVITEKPEEPVITEEPDEPQIPENNIHITIDGLYDDWKDIDSVVTQKNGKLKELKVYRDDKYIYVCVIGSKLNKYPHTQLFINTDNNKNSGYTSENLGLDYLIENGKLYKYAKSNGTDWDFKYVGSIPGYNKTETCIEYKISVDTLDNLSDEIAVRFRILDNAWNVKYQFPRQKVVVC